MMNKEKEALLKEILAKPDEPHAVSKKSIMRLIERMQPETEDMKAYLIAYYSADTHAESQAIRKTKLASMSPKEAALFNAAYLRCLENDVNYGKQVNVA
jgi:hypothetical protein